MTSAVDGWPPVKLVAIGEPQADSAPATVRPPPAARNWRRESPVMSGTFRSRSVVCDTCARILHANRRDLSVPPPGRGKEGAPRLPAPLRHVPRPARRFLVRVEATEETLVKASQQDGSYPRPMMCREAWTSLDGPWQFAHDDAGVGLAE